MIGSLSSFVKNKSIFCYGVGHWGCEIAKYCKKRNIEIAAFLVSDRLQKMEKFYGKPVYGINDVEFPCNAGIIISPKSKNYQNDILKVVKEYTTVDRIYFPFKNEDFIQFFYKACKRKIRKVSRKRKKYHLFNYTALAEPISVMIPFPDNDTCRIYFSNIVYGHGNIVKKHLKMKCYDILQCTIMHSTHADGNFTNRELCPPDGNIFCMSKKSLPASCFSRQINIYPLGPYIKYVKPLITKKGIEKLKERFGRTLLVVPSHVVLDNKDETFSYQIWINEIERIKKEYKFKTVLVSIGPHGFFDKNYTIYCRMGYKIVTSGDNFDTSFLRRVRSFISLSDMTMGNDFNATFLGYSIALDVPYYHFEMDIDYKYSEYLNNEAGYEFRENSSDYGVYVTGVRELFGKYNEFVTAEQREFVKEYWGRWT